MIREKSQVIEDICIALSSGEPEQASTIARREYPFASQLSAKRTYNATASTRVFVRDGFLDRYSGSKLIFPAVLRLLSQLLPTEFPYHRNWKMSECHLAYWELFPTIDHVVPVTRGGTDSEGNWVSTSMLRNSAKSNWTLEELGWNLLPSGDCREWDGLMGWFLEYIKNDATPLKDSFLKRWHRAALLATNAA